MVEATIILKDKLGITLDTREAAMTLFQEVEDCCCDNLRITFDFNGIEFVSRSFADQFHKEKMKFIEKNNCKIEIKDVDERVFSLLQIVSKTQHKTNSKLTYYSVYVFDNDIKLAKFLQAI